MVLTRKLQGVFAGFALAALLMMPKQAGAAVDAETIISGKCTTCHSADRIRDTKRTAEQWRVVVDEEVDRGLDLTRAEKAAVTSWLTKKFGAAAVAETEVAAATAETSAEDQVAAAPTTGGDLPFDKQAETGVELWQFLFSGGALLAGGAWMRRH